VATILSLMHLQSVNIFVVFIALLLVSCLKAMPKLYFRHGAVSSAKTMNLLAVAHNYRLQGKNIVLLKPAMDVRYGTANITSRSGLTEKADFLIKHDTNILDLDLSKKEKVFCVLVDEVQFLNAAQIDQLRLATVTWNAPVICYGLRTDFRTKLFPGSQRLLEVADTIEEVKTTCQFCNKKAIMNLKHVNGKADTSGPVVQLGAEEKYFPTCFKCYRDSLNDANEMLSSSSTWSINSDAIADKRIM
jgi:thymidine kinase